jgi:hypothetical protein
VVTDLGEERSVVMSKVHMFATFLAGQSCPGLHTKMSFANCSYDTIVMAASFRNVGEITELAG